MHMDFILSVTSSLTCIRSLKSSIYFLNMDTDFLGDFYGLIMTFTNRNINLFCAITESEELRILKDGVWAIKMCDVNICFLKSNLILCIRLSKNLQAYASK